MNLPRPAIGNFAWFMLNLAGILMLLVVHVFRP
jgi:hypothetical protein